MNARGIPENVLPCDHRYTGRMGKEPASWYPPRCASFHLSKQGRLSSHPSPLLPNGSGFSCCPAGPRTNRERDDGCELLTASSWPMFRYFSKTISSLFTRKLGMLAPGWFLPSWNTSLVTHQWTKPLTFKAEAEW